MKRIQSTVIAVVLAVTSVLVLMPSPAAALRPTVPCGLSNPFSQPCPAPTTTTTPVRAAQTFYLPEYFPRLEIGIDGWMVLNDVQLGDTVVYLGVSYSVTDLGGDFIPGLQPGPVAGDGVCSVGEYVRPTVAVQGIAAGQTYEQKLKFKVKPISSGSEGTAVRTRYVIRDASNGVKGAVVKIQRRKVGKKLVINGLPAGHYYVEIAVRYVNPADCGRRGWHVVRGFGFNLV